MHQVKVKRVDLLEKVRANRAAHRELFLKAQEGYRKVVVALLDEMLAEARNGGPVRTRVRVQAPEDHTEEYDRVISMLEMSVDDEVTLQATDFDRYVRDKWAWSALANLKNASYAVSSAVPEGWTPEEE
jgi:hypothetical protein